MSLNKTLYQFSVQTIPASIGQEGKDIVYTKEDMFHSNLNHLLNNIQNNSKNSKKEEILKKIIYDISNTPQGREIISSLPRDIKIEINSWKDMLKDPTTLGARGTYNFMNKTISLRPYLFNKFNQKSLMNVFIHELRHANQDALHQTYRKDTFSAHEVFKLGKLREAETYAWYKTNNFCKKRFGNWVSPDKKKIEKFMNRNLIAEKKHILGFLPNPFFNEDKVKQSKDYIFQDALKKNNGDIYVAQKSLTGIHLKELMSSRVKIKDLSWKFRYDNTLVEKAVAHSSRNKNMLSNPTEYNKVLERYQTDYNLKREDIDKIGGGHRLEQALQKIHEINVSKSMRKMPQKSTQSILFSTRATHQLAHMRMRAEQIKQAKMSTQQNSPIPSEQLSVMLSQRRSR